MPTAYLLNRVILALAVLTLSRSTAVSAQTIHRDQIAGFWAMLSADQQGQQAFLKSAGFERWGIVPSARPAESSLKQEGTSYRWVVAYVPEDAPLLEVSELGVAVIPLQQLPAYERQNHVVSFWRTRGDSLVFWFLDKSVHFGFMGRLRIGQHITGTDSTLLIAAESLGRDAGETVGRYEFLDCDLAKRLVSPLYSCSFASDLCSPSDTLRYELRRNVGHITLALFRTRLDSAPDLNAPFGCRRIVVGSDTIYVDLSGAARKQ